MRKGVSCASSDGSDSFSPGVSGGSQSEHIPTTHTIHTKE
jgi:hypothetical protein